jgi:parvulin-like peptidyl-prolyl isomerase
MIAAEEFRSGQSFESLVGQYSIEQCIKKRKGDLGWFSQTLLPPDIAVAARKAKPGTLLPVFQTGGKSNLILFLEQQAIAAITIDTTRESFRRRLLGEKRGQAYTAFVDGLRKKFTLPSIRRSSRRSVCQTWPPRGTAGAAAWGRPAECPASKGHRESP